MAAYLAGESVTTDIQRTLPPAEDNDDDELATSVLVVKPSETDELATQVYPTQSPATQPARLPARLMLHLRAPATGERPQPVDRAIHVTRLPYTIGRSSKRVDLPIRCGDVSRIQCRIAADADGLYVEQLGERSTTIVDGAPVHHGERSATLRHGSQLIVGDAEIVCEMS